LVVRRTAFNGIFFLGGSPPARRIESVPPGRWHHTEVAVERCPFLTLGFRTLFFAVALLPALASAQPPAYLTQWGTYGSGPGQFTIPCGVAVDRDNVYVTDYLNQRIQRFTSDGIYLTEWGTYGSGDGQFFNPAGVATDAAGDVYVVDQVNCRIQKFTSTGTFLTRWGSPGGGDGEFIEPAAVATDATGNVYVVDRGNNRIQRFGLGPVPATSTSWGRIKALYR
jgi:hypothetical protein